MFAGTVGFAAGWLVREPAARPDRPGGIHAGTPREDRERSGTDSELVHLSKTIEALERTVRSLQDRIDTLSAGGAHRPSGEVESARPSRPPSDGTAGDRFDEWTDDELLLVARGKGDDLDLIKAALRRGISSERRAQLLLSQAAFYRRFDPNGESERNSLTEATRIVPTTNAVGAQAAWELGNALASIHLQSQAVPYYEAILRDAPDEHQRMQAAYRLAWRFDLGDDPPATALDAFKKYLADYGEKWKDTPEAIWARHRVSEIEDKQ
jgi:hypothetical protein